MRRLGALETKPVPENQVSPTLGYTYYQTMNHLIEECPVYLAHQMLPKHMNATFARPNNNPYS